MSFELTPRPLFCLAAGCAAYVEEHHPAVDVVVHEGGQPRYLLLVGVE